jgi:hypothetical protein
LNTPALSGVPVVSKISVSLVAVVFTVVIGYLAYNPAAAQRAVNWVRYQVGSTPEMKPVGAPNYMPILPGR